MKKKEKIVRQNVHLTLHTDNARLGILTWEYIDSKNKNERNEINLAKVTDVMTVAKKDPFWQSTIPIEVDPERTVVILSKKQELRVEFNSIDEMKMWLFGINKLLVSKGRRVTVAGANVQPKEIAYQTDA